MSTAIRGYVKQIAEITVVSVGCSLLVAYAMFTLLGLTRIEEALLVAFVSAVVVAPTVTVLFGRSRYRLLRRTRQLERAVRIDGLTRLPNRTCFIERATHILGEAAPTRGPCLLFMDIDHFKNVNDTHGHRAGDEALRRVSRCLRESCRSTDAVGRVGGEEFASMLRGADLEGGRGAAERIRAAVEAIEFDWQGVRIPLTVSIGIAAWRPDEDLDALIEAADQALYVAKRTGRNRAIARDDIPTRRESDQAEIEAREAGEMLQDNAIASAA